MQKKKKFSIFAPVLFWGYNAVYLLMIMLLGLQLSMFGSGFSFTQMIPWNAALMLYLLLLTPFACMIFAYKKKNIREDAGSLMKLFFGVEVPIMGLALMRLMFIREMTPALWLFFFSVVISIIGLLVSLLYSHFKTKLQHTLHFISQEIAMLLVAYIALLFLFFLPIIGAAVIKGLLSIDYWYAGELFYRSAGLILFTTLIWLLFFIFTVGLFFAVPVAATIIYWKSFKNLKKYLGEKYGKKFTKIVGYSFGVFYIFVAFIFSFQSKVDAYVPQLRAIQNASSFEEKQPLISELLKDKNGIRTSLANTYLSPYRYVGDSAINMIEQGYTYEVGTDKTTAIALQQLFNTVASPFIYQGKFQEDVERAATDYEEIFDAHIQEGEKDLIVKALEGTNTQDDVKAGLLNREKKTVHVAEQKVSVTHNDYNRLAHVQFEQTYQNTSDIIQEVYYEFTLPKDAVLTNLLLGPNLEYQAVVSPRGAARTTYENQIYRRIDPALLEQVGPQQYRLRVFPIPAPLSFFERNRRNQNVFVNPTNSDKPQRVLIEYSTFMNKDGVSMPVFTEKRNVYADASTQYTYLLNNKELPQKNELAAVPAGEVSCSKTISTTDIPQLDKGLPVDGNFSETRMSLSFLPHILNPLLQGYTCDQDFDINKISGSTFAVLLDASYSNTFTDWNSYLKEKLHVETLLANDNVIDVYFFNNQLSQKLTLTKETLAQGLPSPVPFGKTNRLKAIIEAKAQREFGGYAAILMVTDSSTFEEEFSPDPTLDVHGTPIYMIHPDGIIPSYSDDLMHAVIKSGGMSVTDPKEAFQHFWLMKSLAIMNGKLGELQLLDVNKDGSWILYLSKDADSAVASTDIAESTPSRMAQASQNDVLLDDRVKIINVLKDAKPDESKEFQSVAAKKVIEAMMKNIDQMEPVGTNALAQIHQLAQEKSIVTPYSSMIALVEDWQKQQLANAENGEDPFSTQYDIGAEGLGMPSGGNMFRIGSRPEPQEWALIVIGLLIGAYFHRKRLRKYALEHLHLSPWK